MGVKGFLLENGDGLNCLCFFLRGEGREVDFGAGNRTVWIFGRLLVVLTFGPDTER